MWITAQQAEKLYGFRAKTLLNQEPCYVTIRTTKLGGRRMFLKADCEALSKRMLDDATRNRAFKLKNIEEALSK
jgi:hypothetical protein